MKRLAPIVLAGLMAFGLPGAVLAAPACGFDTATLTFAGDAAAQARCLLRPVKLMGQLGPEQPLPPTLAARLSQPVSVDAQKLAVYLRSLPDPYTVRLADRLGRPVSTTGVKKAAYFVIHDTSTPDFGLAGIPADFDTDPARNKLNGYLGANAKAHYFVNRLGHFAQGHDFEVPWRATKLELQVAGAPSRGRFLHIELVQPRRKDPAHPGPYGFVAPDPGFTAAQYDTLALLYVVASRRAGQWLIPAFHAALDEGLNDGHDDPQAFQISRFAEAVDRLEGLVGAQAVSLVAGSDAAYAEALKLATPRLAPGARYTDLCIEGSGGTVSDWPGYEGRPVKRCIYKSGGLTGLAYTLHPTAEQLAGWISRACARHPKTPPVDCARTLFGAVWKANNAQFIVAGDVIEDGGGSGCGSAANHFHILFRHGVAVKRDSEAKFCLTGDRRGLWEQDARDPSVRYYFAARVAGLWVAEYEAVTGKAVPRTAVLHSQNGYHPTAAWGAMSQASYLRALDTGEYDFLNHKADATFGKP